MREIGRVQQGYFPTQSRIVHAIAGLFKLPASAPSPIVVLDAGCGTGKAIHDQREIWLAQQPDLDVALLGIESDKNRCQQAASLLASGKGGGTALWSAIEDATVAQPVSMLWFNPPYDRNQGRRTAEVERVDNERIASKWGQYISFSTKDSKGAAMSIRVKRKSELGTGGESKKL